MANLKATKPSIDMPKRFGLTRRTRLSKTPLHKLRATKRKSEFDLFFEYNHPSEADTKRDEKRRALVNRISDRDLEAKTLQTERAYQRAHEIDKRTTNLKFPLLRRLKMKFDLKNPAGLKKFLDMLEAGEHISSPFLKSFIEIARNTKPFFRKGHIVFVADFSKHKEMQHSPGHLIFGMAVVDSNTPERFQNIVIDHEIRESILEGAGYGPIVLRGQKYNRSHSIAIRREQRDLTRRDLMPEYLEWLKTNYPKIFKDRSKRFGQNRKQ